MKPEELYALILISAGHVAFANCISAVDAWDREYETEHVKYMTDNGVPVETAQKMLDLPLRQFVG